MPFPHIDPVFLSIGPLQFRWYGLMYILGFLATWLIIRSEVRRASLQLTSDDVSDLVFWGAMGVVIGGRLGYILFYNPGFYLSNPLKLLAVWEGGMSFHGGFLGVVTSFVIFARRKGISFWTLIDMAAQCAPVGLGLGRIGNFINGELFGRETSVAWGIIFPGGGPLPRHPSQLYEAVLEGFLLFWIVRFCARSGNGMPGNGRAGWGFVAGYGLFRFIVEFFRQPDAQIGLFAAGFSMGQLLSFPMFLLGSLMLFRSFRSPVA